VVALPAPAGIAQSRRRACQAAATGDRLHARRRSSG